MSKDIAKAKKKHESSDESRATAAALIASAKQGDPAAVKRLKAAGLANIHEWTVAAVEAKVL